MLAKLSWITECGPNQLKIQTSFYVPESDSKNCAETRYVRTMRLAALRLCCAVNKRSVQQGIEPGGEGAFGLGCARESNEFIK
jgi:hypothetical protein